MALEHDPASAEREPSGDGIDQYHRYVDDFALLKSLGHKTHLLSLEWSRRRGAAQAVDAADSRPDVPGDEDRSQ